MTGTSAVVIGTPNTLPAGTDYSQQDFSLTIAAAGYVSWQAARFSPEELLNLSISGDTADPDHDGISNMLECALGLEPRSSDPGCLPVAEEQDGHLAFTYRQSKAATDLAFLPQAASDLGEESWSSTGLTETARVDMGTRPGVARKVTANTSP